MVTESKSEDKNSICGFGTYYQTTFLNRPVTNLERQVGRSVFWDGPKCFKPYAIVLYYVQHIFPEGEKKFAGGWTLITGPFLNSLEINANLHRRKFCPLRYKHQKLRNACTA